MKAFDLDPRIRWAFCFTHPDDEISICAFLRRLVLSGSQVFVGWTHSNPVREREARAVAEKLGIPDENLMFFEAPDQGVVDEIEKLIPMFQDWFATIRPDRVACGAFEQGHIDHDATNFVLSQVFHGPIFEIPFYHTYLTPLQTLNRFSDPRGEEVICLEPEERSLKRYIAKQYPSQNIWSVLLWYEIWQVTRLRGMRLARTERMRLQSHFDFSKPNHPTALAQRVARSEIWLRWLASIERVCADESTSRKLEGALASRRRT